MKRASFFIPALASALLFSGITFLAGCNSAGGPETTASAGAARHPVAQGGVPYAPVGPDGAPLAGHAQIPQGTHAPQPGSSSPYQGTAPSNLSLSSRDGAWPPPTATALPGGGNAFPSLPGPKPAGDPPTITARNALLVDGMGRVLFEKNADARVHVASTQKLLLALMVVERGNLSGTVTVAEPDTWCEPTKMGLQPGQVYTREQLLRAVLIRSSNDIARCLARDHSGSDAAFAAAMNVRARQLGMHNSYFTNSSGLPKPEGQRSTARDLVILARAAMNQPFIRSTVRMKTYTFRFPDGTTRTLTNTNQVLRNFAHCTGAKTGYTNLAGRCLVSTASGNGSNVTAVVLGSKTPTIWTESEALLRYGLGM